MVECPSNAMQVHGDADAGIEKVWRSKSHLHARLHSLPLVSGRHWKRSLGAIQTDDTSHLVTVSGTVIRTGTVRMVETSREYECGKCHHRFIVYSDLDQGHTLTVPESCPAPGRKRCRGSTFELVAGSSQARDYQRIKIQDAVMKLSLGSLPKSIYVTLHDDLVDRCQAGDEVDIVGVVRRHWTAPLYRESHCHCELYIDAVHVSIHHDRRASAASSSTRTDAFLHEFRSYWQEAATRSHELLARNLIVTSFCPKLYGLFLVKLAVVLTIIGGVQHTSATGSRVRGECHLLLVGDAGTGKSQLLKYATKVSPRSILTTGMGTTSAGLTVAVVKEPGGEWGLEAGALVLADGGVWSGDTRARSVYAVLTLEGQMSHPRMFLFVLFLPFSCIDEFGCIRPDDRATIHEAMEQQTVSVAKAGLMCTLNTRTTVFGAMNPKGSYDHDADLSVNTALATPLLSRFDLVLLLLDRRDHAWDEQVVGHIMDGLERPVEEEVVSMSRDDFEAEAKQRRRRMDDAHAPTQTQQAPPMTQAGLTPPTDGAEMRPWEVERLQAYIQYVRYNFFPILTPLAGRILTRYYQFQRSADSRSAARTTIRLLESLARLAQAHARLMWRHAATAQDACMAVLVMESSLASCSVASTRDGVSLGAFAQLSDRALHAADETYPEQMTALLAKLDLRVTDAEYAAEQRADEENARAVLGEGEAFEERKARRQERERIEQQAREAERQRQEARMAEEKNRPASFAAFSDGADAAFAPTAFATTPATSLVHTVSLAKPRPTIHRTQTTAGALAPARTIPPQQTTIVRREDGGSTTAARFAPPVRSTHADEGIASTQVPYDPFSTATHVTTIPAFTNSQMHRGIESAKAKESHAPLRTDTIDATQLAATSSPSHPRPTASAVRPVKRARLGVATPRSTVAEDDDDEDQSIMMMTSGPARPARRDSHRTPVTVKKETVDPAHESRAPGAVSTAATAVALSSPSRSLPPLPQPAPTAPSVDPLQQLLNSGMSKLMAQSILANPLRAATAAPPQAMTHAVEHETSRPEQGKPVSPAVTSQPTPPRTQAVSSLTPAKRHAAPAAASPATIARSAPPAAVTNETIPRTRPPQRPDTQMKITSSTAPGQSSRTPSRATAAQLAPQEKREAASFNTRTLPTPAKPTSTSQPPASAASKSLPVSTPPTPTSAALSITPVPAPSIVTMHPSPIPTAARSTPLALPQHTKPLSMSLALPTRANRPAAHGMRTTAAPLVAPPLPPPLSVVVTPPYLAASGPSTDPHRPTSTAGSALLSLLSRKPPGN